jgi:signal transduction histidine kinase
MLQDVERLDQLINHLLDVARMDRRTREKTSAEPLALAEVLTHSAATVSSRYSQGQDLVQLDLEPVTVMAPRVDLELIFRNVIDNAIKYAGDPPRVAVQLRAEQGMAVVRVTDNGRGIPKHLRHKVFGRFVRLGTELQRERPGTGLGLFIVWTMIRRLRGTIRIGSGPLGEGTTVTIWLPLPQPGARRLQAPAEPTPTATAGGGIAGRSNARD